MDVVVEMEITEASPSKSGTMYLLSACSACSGVTAAICSSSQRAWSTCRPSYADDHASAAAESLFDFDAMREYASEARALPNSTSLITLSPEA